MLKLNVDTKTITVKAPLYEGRPFLGQGSLYQGKWQIEEELKDFNCSLPDHLNHP